jgi:hypothetical protein
VLLALWLSQHAGTWGRGGFCTVGSSAFTDTGPSAHRKRGRLHPPESKGFGRAPLSSWRRQSRRVRGSEPVAVTGDACVKRRTEGSPAGLVPASLKFDGRPYSSDGRLRGLAEGGVVVPRHYVLSGPERRYLRSGGCRDRVLRSENQMCGDKQPRPYLRSAYTWQLSRGPLPSGTVLCGALFMPVLCVTFVWR